MRGCWCGPPNIYNSREEAEAAVGHLRFYVVGDKTKNLRVLQRKDDPGWHCSCGIAEYHPVYKELISASRKRAADESEVDLLAQDRGSRRDGQCVERIVPAPGEPTSADEEQAHVQEASQAQGPKQPGSMWAQACSILSRTLATMGSPLVNLLGKFREQVRGDAYETLDTRRKDAENGTIIVKRLKRQVPVPATDQTAADDEDDGFEDLVWADDPTKRIGLEQIERLAGTFASQYQNIEAGNVIGGASIADIQLQIQEGQDLGASIAIHQYQEHEYGPAAADEPEEERAEKLLHVLSSYKRGLLMSINFMQVTYNRGLFEDLKTKHKKPPRRLPLGTVEFRQGAKTVGEFLCFLRSLDRVCKIDTATLETICKMIVDANAIHKQEMLPSFVEVQPNPTQSMPGFFPEEKASALEDIPADELTIQPLYDFKFPSPEPEEPQARPGDYRLVPKPKGILKPSREWAEPPASPRYVPTPEKKKKLSFKNPVSSFIPPANIPARIMTPQEADQIVKAKLKAEVVGDEHSIRMFEATRTVSRQRDTSLDSEEKWSLEALERDEREMGLSYHALKYGEFLNDLRRDLEKRAEEDKENRTRPTWRLTPRKRIVRIPMPPLPSTPELRRRAAHLLESDSGSPAASSPAVNPLMHPKVDEQQPQKVAEKKRAPATLEEFFQEDEDDLAISTAKLEQLQIDRQIRQELEVGIQRELEEKRKREEEEALREQERRLKEEIRRKEEERRRKEEERRREQEARRRKEAEEFAALTGLRPPARPLITALSGDWEAKVANAARANPTAELVKTLEGQPLTRRDFEEKLLPPTAWLNDNVIIGSILHIADYVNTAKGATNQEPKCAAFTSYFWPRLVSQGPNNCGRLLRRAGVRKANFLDIDTVLIPICAHAHWTLAVIRPGRRTVAHIDSMQAGRGDAEVKNRLLDLVRFILEDRFVEDEWRAVDYEAPLQTNGWDCGVFTITNAMCLALGLNPKHSYTERELTLQRRRVAAVLLNEGFKGEFSLDGF